MAHNHVPTESRNEVKRLGHAPFAAQKSGANDSIQLQGLSEKRHRLLAREAARTGCKPTPHAARVWRPATSERH